MIAIEGLTKRYRARTVLDGVTLDVPAGSICGLLGRNGAGKTTTFRCALRLARPDAGEVRFGGEPLRTATFERLGYVPDRPSLYAWLTVQQHLHLAARAYRTYDAARARELLATFRLDPAAQARALSRGQETALSLVLAFAIRPSLLLLDEPTGGLDPLLQRATLELIIDAASGGASVLFSSHAIGQLERAADRVAVLRDGRIVLSGDIEALRASEKIVEATFDDGAFRSDTPALAGVRRWEHAGAALRAYTERDPDAVAAELARAGARSVRVLDRNLEDLFMDAIADETAR
ncbi:MAG: type transport system ATP-binding protein [Candidatus Eremiobacteraeota bacterium]|nr:type transport system ATP-binding protein [Candidatus Eremiobacteraeota bacterium]